MSEKASYSQIGEMLCKRKDRPENTELSARPSEQQDKRKQSHKLKFLRNTLLWIQPIKVKQCWRLKNDGKSCKFFIKRETVLRPLTHSAARLGCTCFWWPPHTTYKQRERTSLRGIALLKFSNRKVDWHKGSATVSIRDKLQGEPSEIRKVLFHCPQVPDW